MAGRLDNQVLQWCGVDSTQVNDGKVQEESVKLTSSDSGGSYFPATTQVSAPFVYPQTQTQSTGEYAPRLTSSHLSQWGSMDGMPGKSPNKDFLTQFTMSGGPPHNPHGRQAPPNSAWNHLQQLFQVPNFFPRQPQHAHMSSELPLLTTHQPTWHTPTTEPSKSLPHNPLFNLQQMLSSPERQFPRCVNSPGVDLSLTRNGNQNGDLPLQTPISLSVRDAKQINSLPPSALEPDRAVELTKVASPGLDQQQQKNIRKQQSKKVDSILERLNPALSVEKVQSVIVTATSSHDENSNSSVGTLNIPSGPSREDEVVSPASTESSLDSNQSRRKRKPNKTVKLPSTEDLPPDDKTQPKPHDNEPESQPTPEKTALRRRSSSEPSQSPPSKSRRKTFSESETIDNIAAMVAATEIPPIEIPLVANKKDHIGELILCHTEKEKEKEKVLAIADMLKSPEKGHLLSKETISVRDLATILKTPEVDSRNLETGRISVRSFETQLGSYNSENRNFEPHGIQRSVEPIAFGTHSALRSPLTHGNEGTLGNFESKRVTEDQKKIHGTHGTQGTQIMIHGTQGSMGDQLSHGTTGSHGTQITYSTPGTHGTQLPHGTLETHGTQGTHGTQLTHGTQSAHGTQSTHGTQLTHGTPVSHGTQGTQMTQETLGTPHSIQESLTHGFQKDLGSVENEMTHGTGIIGSPQKALDTSKSTETQKSHNLERNFNMESSPELPQKNPKMETVKNDPNPNSPQPKPNLTETEMEFKPNSKSDLPDTKSEISEKSSELKNETVSQLTVMTPAQKKGDQFFVAVEDELEKMFAGIADSDEKTDDQQEEQVCDPLSLPSTSNSNQNESNGVTSTTVNDNDNVKITNKRNRANQKKANRRMSENSNSAESTPRKKHKVNKKGFRDVSESEKSLNNSPNKKGNKKVAKALLTKEKDVYSYDSGSNASSSRSRGPFIQIRGPRDSPLSVNIVNTPSNENDGDGDKPNKVKNKKFHDDSEYRHKVRSKGLHCSTLSNKYDAQTRDVSWICVFCKRGPHATEFQNDSLQISEFASGGHFSPYYSPGDLFGPYIISTDCPEYQRRIDDPYDALFKSKRSANALLNETNNQHNQPTKSAAKKTKKRQNSESNTNRDSIDSSDCNRDIMLGIAEVTPSSYEVWVHEDCVTWSPNVYLVGPKIIGLEGAVWCACSIVCKRCGLKGATVNCLKRGCATVMHIGCAKISNWNIDEENYKAFCTEHSINYNINNSKLP